LKKIIRFIKKNIYTKIGALVLFIAGMVFRTPFEHLTGGFWDDVYQKKLRPAIFSNTIAEGPLVDCLYTFCSIFTNDADMWDGYSTLVVRREGDGVLVRAPVTEKLAGWIMQYDKPILPDFDASFKFTPLNRTPNVVFGCGDVYQIIVGDGSSNKITLKTNYGYVYPIGTPGSHFRLAKNMQQGAVVILNLSSQKDEETNDIYISGQIIYIATDGERRTEQIPKYVISGKLHPGLQVVNLGVGVIDPIRTGKIEAIFHSLDVQKKLSSN
jgi:hypothetical protein